MIACFVEEHFIWVSMMLQVHAYSLYQSGGSVIHDSEMIISKQLIKFILFVTTTRNLQFHSFNCHSKIISLS
jgi:hypothetical protein